MINCVQFLVLTNISMFFYPGGTFNDPNTSGYSILGNLFSDLGRYVAHSGESNIVACVLYNTSLFLMGVLLIPYFVAMPSLFGEKGEGRGFCFAGSIIGVLVSIAMAGASLTPADLLYEIHVSFGAIKFFSLIPLVMLYITAIFENKAYPDQYAVIFIVFGVMQFIFLIIMSFSASEQEISVVFAAGQNIVVNAMAICFLVQAYGAWKMQQFRKTN